MYSTRQLVCLFGCFWKLINVCTYVCMYVCIMYVCMYAACMYVCMYVCMYMMVDDLREEINNRQELISELMQFH